MAGTGNSEENTQRTGNLCLQDQLNILLKEWEKNVDLYIDQDKRGFQRIGMFLAIHAGLLLFFTKILTFGFIVVSDTFKRASDQATQESFGTLSDDLAKAFPVVNRLFLKRKNMTSADSSVSNQADG